MPGNPQPAYTQAQLDHAARQQGFPDYATYQGWYQKYRQQGPGTPAQAAPAQTKNWLQRSLESIPVHPAYLFNKVTDAMTKAGL